MVSRLTQWKCSKEACKTITHVETFDSEVDKQQKRYTSTLPDTMAFTWGWDPLLWQMCTHLTAVSTSSSDYTVLD